MLKTRSVLITAGPTWEALDPVRGITNHSSGKMGYALAQVARQLGAVVTLISGPVCINAPENIKTLQVQSAQQMYDAVHQQILAQNIDVFISVAAVADYRPAEIQAQKIKKSADTLTLTLLKNPDIVASVARLENRRPYTVGFAAETQQLEDYAHAKLKAKNLDMIIANDVSEKGIGFGADQNAVLIITEQVTTALPKQAKMTLASTILNHISQKLI